jgi:hypothetical protein
MKRLIVLLLIAGSVGAQTANVIGIDAMDADRARAAWYALQKAQTDWNTVNADMTKKYLHAGPNEPYSNCFNGQLHIKSGWNCGEIDFSSDFRHIVPKIISPVPADRFCFGTIVPTNEWDPSIFNLNTRRFGYDSIKSMN